MSGICNQCIVDLKRQNAFVISDDEMKAVGDGGLSNYLDRILKEQYLKDGERMMIKKLKHEIKNNKIK